MRRHRGFTMTVLVAALATLATRGAAQPQDLEARVDALAEEVEKLRDLAVQAPPVADAVESLADAVAALEEDVETLRRQKGAVPDVIDATDELETRVRDLERSLALLRAKVADLEQPVILSPGEGSVERDGGFSWETDDGDYELRVIGLLQPRYQLELASGYDDVETQTLRLRRAETGVSGHLRPSLRYKIELDWVEPGLIRDAFLEYQVLDALAFRAGQFKVPHTRATLTSSSNLGFAERPRVADAVRYNRDIAASILGETAGGRVAYQAGVGNGSGSATENDSIDLMGFLRVDGALFGERFGKRIADVEAQRKTSLMAGASLVHDVPRSPDAAGGVALENTDVDNDGERDAIRVTSASADVALSHRGFNLTLEGLFRREDWGAILDHPDNAAVAGFVGEGVEHYLGGYGQVTYAAWPERLVVGARVGGIEQPLLGIGGRDPAAPRDADAPPDVGMLWELSAMGQLYRDNEPFLGLDYTHFQHEIAGGGPGHRVILQTQIQL